MYKINKSIYNNYRPNKLVSCIRNKIFNNRLLQLSNRHKFKIKIRGMEMKFRGLLKVKLTNLGNQ